MANISLEAIQLYQRAIDTVLAHESKTEILKAYAPSVYAQIENSFNHAGRVRIPKGSAGRLANYKAGNQSTPADGYVHFQSTGGDGFKRNDARLDFEEIELQCNRGVEFQIDRVEGKKIDDLLKTYVVTQFPRTAVVPEVDAFRFAYLASRAKASYGNLVEETPDAEGGDTDIYTLLSKALTRIYDMGADEESQIIFLSPECYNLLVNSGKTTRVGFIGETKIGDAGVVYKTFQGRPLVQVPSNRFFNKITLSDNGYAPASGAKSINYLIVSANSVLLFDILSTMNVYDSNEAHLGFDGWAIDYHFYHGIYVPDNKVPAIYCSLGSTLSANAGGRLFVDTEAGSASGTTVVTGFGVLPGDLNIAKVAYDTSAHDYGTKFTATSKIIDLNTDVTLGDSVYFYGLDANNLIIAKSIDKVTPTKKA